MEGVALFRFSAGSSTSTIRDLRIGFALPAIGVDSGVTGIVISGNRIRDQVRISGNDNVVGGTTVEDRNFGEFSIFVGGSGNDILANISGSGDIRVSNAADTRIGAEGSGNSVATIFTSAPRARSSKGTTHTGSS